MRSPVPRFCVLAEQTMRDAGSVSTERRQVHYSGRVQGVGFRYEAERLAGGYAVVGYVQNLNDGRVKLVVEGAPRELDRYLDDLAQRLGDRIADVAVDVGPGRNEFTRFEIRR